jgi:hypothetical protein
MDRYTGHHEIRFKITDQEAKLFQDTANYLYYEKHILQKPNIQELARWYIKNAVNASQDLVIQSKIVRQQGHQQIIQQYRAQQLMKQQNLGNPLVYQQQGLQKQRIPTIDNDIQTEEQRILSDLESLQL